MAVRMNVVVLELFIVAAFSPSHSELAVVREDIWSNWACGEIHRILKSMHTKYTHHIAVPQQPTWSDPRDVHAGSSNIILMEFSDQAKILGRRTRIHTIKMF